MINGKTGFIGLLGQPVDHSLSPVIHNAALNEMGLNWCYLAFPCESKDLGIVATALRNIHCNGLNITIPHKQHILNVCKYIDPLAKQLGAVNTLLPNKEGGWTGRNTDVEGFLSPLKTKNWTKKNAIIIGAGGSARAVLMGLQTLNFNQITITSRRQDALDDFILEFKNKTRLTAQKPSFLKGLLDKSDQLIEEIIRADLIVNTTPVGMSPNHKISYQENRVPLGKEIWQYLQQNTTLYDLIYSPRPTSWLTLGAKKNCEQIDGLEMLIQQGAASLKLWSNVDEVPIDVMRKAAKEYLKT